MAKIKLPRIKQSIPLEPKEFRALLKFLPEGVRILVQTYKFASEAYAEIGLSYYWEEIFQLSASSIYTLEGAPLQIRLERSSRYATRGELWLDHYIPEELALNLLFLSSRNSGSILFQQEDGKAFNNLQLGKEFYRASQCALKAKKIKHAITPICLRATPSPNIKIRSGAVKVVTKEKVQEIMEILPPRAWKVGRPQRQSLQDILHVLRVQEGFKYSRSELIGHYPGLARAAEAQKRRWIKKGIWNQILQILTG